MEQMQQKEVIETTYKQQEVVNEFDDQRDLYAFQKYKHKTESEFLMQTIHEVNSPDVKVLDVACGTGRMFREVVKDERVIYYGVDTSSEMMAVLKQSAEDLKKNAWLFEGDATNLMYKDDTFDVTFSFHLTWHLPQELQEKMILEMIRVTKPGGYVVFDILNKNFIWEKVKHLFGKEKLPDIYKMTHSEVTALIGGYQIEKLNDFPVKSNFFYKMLNIVNEVKDILPKNMFHFLYYRIEV